jgi:putative DNA primase/helicase
VRTKLGPDIDVRSDGGCAVAPPSIHPNGKQYKWLNKNTIKPLPKKLKELLISISPKTNMKPNTNSFQRRSINVGERNSHLTSLAGALHARSTSEDAILTALFAENKTFVQPLPEEEVEKIAESISRYTVSGFVHELTDAGNGRRFADLYGEETRYCHNWDQWFIWNGTRWLKDENGEAQRRAKETARTIYAEAAASLDEYSRKRLAAHAKQSERASAIRAMLFLAQSESKIAIKPSDFDRDLWLLNVKNGTINLRTGELEPSNREHLITKVAPVEYSPKAKCPQWEKFLFQIMSKDREMISFLQRAIGYSLTGDTTEQKFFFLFGSGANGKSTFLNIIREMLGDYAVQAAPELLVAKQVSSHPTELADLQGSRFVVAVEIEEGKRMAESLVKQVTGGDMIKARKLYQDFSEFAATFKLFLAANHKLTVLGDDHGIWRRVLLVPFTVTIPEAKRDTKLLEKLRKELPGILAWAVRGCLDWKEQGLMPPAEVQNATASYKSEMDTVESFLNDQCVIASKEKVKVTDLFTAFIHWCGKNGQQSRLNRNDFSTRLKNRGYKSKREGKGYMWLGLGLNDERDTASWGFGS